MSGSVVQAQGGPVCAFRGGWSARRLSVEGGRRSVGAFARVARRRTGLALVLALALAGCMTPPPTAQTPPLVGIIMGSTSDWETMRHAAEVLEQ